MMRSLSSTLTVGLSGQRGLGGAADLVARLRNARTVWRLRLGRPGIAALLLLLLAAGIGSLLIIPVQHEMAFKEQRLQLLNRADIVRRAPTGSTATGSSQPGLAPETSFPDQLDRLVQCASDHGLTLNDGQYTVTIQGEGQVVRYEVTLPLHGSYPQIRRFLAAQLGKEYGVALLDIQFRRAKVSDPVLEAVVRLAFYLRPSA